MIIEVLKEEDLDLYRIYVLRENKLYKTDSLSNVKLNEPYCFVSKKPPGSEVISLTIYSNFFGMFNLGTWRREVCNSEYFNIDGIKNFILNNGEFKNWWD